MRRVQNGDAAALTVLVERHARGLLNFIYHYTMDRTWAEDLTQDVFAAAHERAGSYDPHKPFRPWLYALARHRAIDFVRRRSYEVEHHGNLDTSAASGQPTPLDELEREERARFARMAMESLSEKLRVVLVLCHIHGFSYEEAGAVLRCNVKTISSRLSRARDRFRQSLEKYIRL